MTGRRITTTLTLMVLLVVLVAMAVYGFKAATAPVGDGDEAVQKSTCSAEDREVRNFLRRSDVQVSVFNAGDRAGFASQTLEKVEAAGFRGGDAGNAPEDVDVRRALVWTTKPADPEARLVALALGRNTRVEVTETDLGPGVDVLVGNRFKGVDKSAVKRLRLARPVSTCVETD